MMVTNRIDSPVQLSEEPDSTTLAIRQLLEQLKKRNNRLSLLRYENEQLKQQLAERDTALKMLSAQLAEKDEIVPSLSTQLAEKDQTVQTLSTQLAENDGLLRTLSSRLEEKDGLVQTLTTQLADKDELIQTLSAELQKQDRAFRSQVERAGEQTGLLSTQLLDTQSELKRIRDTFGWRLLSQHGRFKYRFLLPVYRLLGRASAEATENKSQ